MLYLVGIACILSALATTGHCLSCISCHNATSPSCEGGNVTCQEGYVCASVHSQTTKNKITSDTFLRTCAPKKDCNINGSITYSDRTLRLATSCCNTSDCNPETPQLPDNNGNNKNGLICRSCLSDKSDWCYTSDEMKCTGEEKMCIRQAIQITGSKKENQAFRGCATKSICDLDHKIVTYDGKTLGVNFICTNGNIGLHNYAFTSVIISVLLLKCLF